MKHRELSEDEQRFKRLENGSLASFFRAFFLSSLYGALAFFALWALKDGVPLLLLALLPRVPASNPSQLITYATVAVFGIAWFVSYIALWLILERTQGAKSIFKKLGVWCGAAALAWLVGEAMIFIALLIS